MSQNGKGPRDRRQGQDFKKWDESKLWKKGVVKMDNVTLNVKTEAGEPFDLSGCEITTHVKEMSK